MSVCLSNVGDANRLVQALRLVVHYGLHYAEKWSAPREYIIEYLVVCASGLHYTTLHYPSQANA